MNVEVQRGERVRAGELTSDPQFRAKLADGHRVFFRQTKRDGKASGAVWFEVSERGDGSLRYVALTAKPEGL